MLLMLLRSLNLLNDKMLTSITSKIHSPEPSTSAKLAELRVADMAREPLFRVAVAVDPDDDVAVTLSVVGPLAGDHHGVAAGFVVAEFGDGEVDVSVDSVAGFVVG